MKTLTKASIAVRQTDLTLDNNQLQQIVQLSRTLNGETVPLRLCVRMASALEEIVPCMQAYVWLADNGMLRSIINNRVVTIAPDESAAGLAYLEKRLVHISNPSENDRLNPEIDHLNGASLGHLLTQPVFDPSGKEVLAVLQLMNSAIHPFSSSVISMLSEWALVAGNLFVATRHNYQLQQAFDSMVNVVSSALDTRDYISAGHSRRVTLYAIELARMMEVPHDEIKQIRYAGLLHDIGKIAIPELILLRDRRPTEDEFQIMKRHVYITRSLLEKIKWPDELGQVTDIASAHHEHIDGSGYPRGKKGDIIPRAGKILAVCDVFDSLSSRRPYEDRMPIDEIIQLLDRETGTSFEPFVVYHFKNIPLDKIVQIMEYGHADSISQEHLTYLEQFAFNDLEKVNKLSSEEQKKLFRIFNLYYSRKYRPL